MSVMYVPYWLVCMFFFLVIAISGHSDSDGEMDRLQERLQDPLPMVYGERVVRK